MEYENMDVDIVYLWVDGSDPEWQEKKRIFTGIVSDNSEQNNIGRYVSNHELKYALRSAEKHAPWIRKIFIVTDNQKPDWLNTAHPKIQVVDHKEIMPPEILPCFNSSVIEYFLHKIPGLSEHFLFSNDDMFFNANLSSDFFFADDGFPIIRLKKKPFGKWHYRVKALVGKKLGQYLHKVHQGALTVEKRFGKYYPGVPHHNIDAYRKVDYQRAVEDIFVDQVKKSQANRTRIYGDLHRSAFSYYSLAIGHAHLKYVGRKESSRILVHRHDFMKYINKYNPKLFCLNDSQKVTNKQREKITPFLSHLFPAKSVFEK
ncbi:MAG: Stealth CR1 domain-containing protein [Cyclobacteriaceae bacterium]|nr:Stealth CR1 domain-containing protein [Cyclobacteriaceae bacterium]